MRMKRWKRIFVENWLTQARTVIITEKVTHADIMRETTVVIPADQTAVPAVADADRLFPERTSARPAARITEEPLTMALSSILPMTEENRLSLFAVPE